MAQTVLQLPSVKILPSDVILGGTTTQNSEKGYNGISLLKGLLIILVIIGHLLPGLQYNIWTYIIYSFHMPLFFGIAGFLVNDSYLEKTTFTQIWQRYGLRIFKPWAIAAFTYYLLEMYFSGEHWTFESAFNFFLFPKFHLWFAAAFMVYVFFFTCMKKLHWSQSLIFITALVVTVISAAHFEYLVPWDTYYNTVPGFIYKSYKPHYFLFFVMGYILKTRTFGPKIINLARTLVIGIFGLRLYYFYSVNGLYYPPFITWDFFVLNLCLIILIIPFFNHNRFDLNSNSNRSRKWKYFYYPFMWIGINSLYIYLWHGIFRYLILYLH
jgi:fucose 4-O-acetylase-like acetyltransferase